MKYRRMKSQVIENESFYSDIEVTPKSYIKFIYLILVRFMLYQNYDNIGRNVAYNFMEDIQEPLTAQTPENVEQCIEKPKAKDENYRLGGRPPLITLLLLALGPTISQIVSACYGIVSSMWVAKAMGKQGMAALSLFGNLDGIGRAFGFFMNCSASQKISSLFGEKKGEEAGQVICDLLRCSIVCGMIVPALLLPVTKPLGKWFGADEETNQMGFEYLIPLLSCSCVTCFYLMLCGALQAEGRTMLVSVAQVSSFVLNMGVFCPLFLFVFHMKTPGAGFATICSDLCPTVVIFILYFRGKFSVKPKLSGFFKKFSPHTWPALSVGVSQLAANVSRSIPSVLLRKFLGEASLRQEGVDFNDTMAGFNAVFRVGGVTDSIRFAISMALLPTASYANSAHLFNRFMFLVIHASWLNITWGTTTCLLTAFGSKYVALMISKEPGYLKMAAPMIRTANWEAPFAWVRFEAQTIMQALAYGKLSTTYSIIATFFTSIGAYCVLYYTDKANVVRMLWSFSIMSGVSCVLGISFLIYPIKNLYHKAKTFNDEKEEKEIESLDGESKPEVIFEDKGLIIPKADKQEQISVPDEAIAEL